MFIQPLGDPGPTLALPIRGVRSARLLDGGARVRVRATATGTELLGLARPADAADRVVPLVLRDG